jgi:hypothetical protein
MRTTRPKGKDAHEAVSEGVGDSRLRWYPRSWRARYGDEVIALLDDEYGGHPPALVRLSLVTGGLRQRTRQSGLTGDSVPAADGIRAGALLVLSAWTVFVIAGASFAKFSEHFDQALPHSTGAHRVPDIAFTVLQAAAGVAGVLVVAGALLAVPAFWRFLRAGGWASLRGHFLRALTCTGITAAATVLILVSAHHLTPHQRDGGLHWYGALFLIWATLIGIALTLWTVVAIAAARRVELTAAILTAEATLAGAVTVAMVLMVAATAIWWGAMAKDAPTFLNASPGGAAASPWDVWLIATVALMAVAMGTAATGVLREVRVWTKMRMVDRGC